MIVRIKKANHEIIVIHKFPILSDARLSLKAKGLLTYLCGHSDDWEARIEDICKHCKDGRESVISGLKELQAAGYAVKSYFRNEKGQIIDTHWSISEMPAKKTDIPKSENPISVTPKSGKPTSEKPISVKNDTPLQQQGNSGNSPKSGFPTSGNPTLHNNKNLIRNNDQARNNERERATVQPVAPAPENLQIFSSIFGRDADKLTIFQQEQIAALPDHERFRQACQWWALQGYKPTSIGRLIERYNEQASFPQRETKQSIYEQNKALLATDLNITF